MKTIYKYEALSERRFSISMPIGARILSVQVQRRTPQIWALVDPEAPTRSRTFRLLGTGHPFEGADGCRYIGTFQVEDGMFVFHLFEEIGEPIGVVGATG